MPNNPITRQEIDLAWARVKNDHKSRNFITHPFEVELIENDFDSWIQALIEDYNGQQYSPSPLYICDIPKPNGLLRSGSHLQMKDAVIYYTLVGNSLEKIYNSLRWSQGTVDYSYQLNPEFNRIDWTKNRFYCWSQFRENSFSAITDDIKYVIITDITAFYDNIDISILSSDLRQISISNDLVSILSRCLNKWAITDGRGIPQGNSASDILAKIYLNSIDLHFHTLRIPFLRYVDDIRIFCKSKAEARIALIELTSCLRKRGLSLQSSKTQIYKVDEARMQIDGIHPTLVEVRDEFIQEIRTEIQNLGPYATISEIEEEYTNQNIEDSEEVLIKAFESYIVDEIDFDKSLFHFLLNRLGVLGCDYAKTFCLNLLHSKPEESEAVIGYFVKLDILYAIQDDILLFLHDESSVYYYQKYLIIKAFYENDIQLNSNFIEYVRNHAFNNSVPFYFKSICIAILKEYTNLADLEKLQRDYPHIRNDLEQAEILICLKKLERARRNHFYSQRLNDGFYIKNAVEMVRNGRL